MEVRTLDPNSSFAPYSLCDHGQVVSSLLSFQVCRMNVWGKAQGLDALKVSRSLLCLFTGPSRPFCWTYLLLFLKLHLGVSSVTIYPVKWESCWGACLHLLVWSWAPLPPVWSISTSLWEFLQVRTHCTTGLTLPHSGVVKHINRAIIHKLFTLLDAEVSGPSLLNRRAGIAIGCMTTVKMHYYFDAAAW